MLTTASARAYRNDIEQRMNPGYRNAEPARLLADAYALALTLADTTDSRALKRDALDLALQIEPYVLDTLSDIRVSRDDVLSQFELLRRERTGWPAEISQEAWERLKAARTLRDISDVLCGGGDYWEAIRVALDDEFDPVAPAGKWSPHTLYLAFDERDWTDASALVARLAPDAAGELQSILSRVKTRTDDRFAMVVWSVQDILDAVARSKDDSRHDLEEASWEDAGVTREWVEDVMITASSQMSDRMTERGWEILEDVISDSLSSSDDEFS